MSLLLLLTAGDPDAPPDIGQRVVTARLLDQDGVEVPGDPLLNSFDIQWQDPYNNPGTGSLTLPLSEAGAAELLPGRFVDCMVNGISRFTFEIEGNPDYKVIQVGEERDQVVTVSGRGWGCQFDKAITEPEHDLALRLADSWRRFSFASDAFPNGPWDKAVEVFEYLEAVDEPNLSLRGRVQRAPDGLLYPAPIGFPWPTSLNNYGPGPDPDPGYQSTFWIWSAAGESTDEFGIGWCFFRGDFVLSSPAIITFSPTGDNFFTFYLAGSPIIAEDSDLYMWQGWKPQPVPLPAGTYRVAAVVENVSVGLAGEGVNQNPGGFLVNAYEVDSDNVPTTVHLTSDDTWEALFVGSTDKWPGWTPGQIVQKLIDEAVARGGLNVYASNTFAPFVDSNGQPYEPVDTTIVTDEVPSFAVEVGTTLMHALDELHRQGWINWHARPGTLLLDIFSARPPASPTAVATLAAGVNIGAMERNATAAYANALLVQWSEGYVWVEDAGEIAARGRVEDIFASDANSVNDAEQAGRTELDRRIQSGYPNIIIQVEPTSYADTPYEGYRHGDYLDVPGEADPVPLLSIACRQDELGYAVWTLELNRRQLVPEVQQAELIRQIGGKSQILRGAVN